MFWKKKPETTTKTYDELTEEEKKIVDRCETIANYAVTQLDSDRRNGIIAEWQYELEIAKLMQELDAIGTTYGEDYTKDFDTFMGHPLEWMEELFKPYDKAVKEIEDDGE